ncbi:hypothetical protein BCC0191_006265 [Burkholderia ambifaria]
MGDGWSRGRAWRMVPPLFEPRQGPSVPAQGRIGPPTSLRQKPWWRLPFQGLRRQQGSLSISVRGRSRVGHVGGQDFSWIVVSRVPARSEALWYRPDAPVGSRTRRTLPVRNLSKHDHPARMGMYTRSSVVGLSRTDRSGPRVRHVWARRRQARHRLDACDRGRARRSVRLENLLEQFHETGVGMCSRSPMARHAEYDPTRPLVRALLFHQHHDDRQDASEAAP